jgi:hypothetical protein
MMPIIQFETEQGNTYWVNPNNIAYMIEFPWGTAIIHFSGGEAMELRSEQAITSLRDALSVEQGE